MRHLTCLLWILILGNTLYAQHLIEGKVSDGSQPLQGVTVFFPESFEGTQTDSMGYFSFNTSLEETQWLHFDYLGFRPDSLKIDLGAAPVFVEMMLKTGTSDLLEIVVSAGTFEASDTRKTAVLTPVDIVTTGASGDIASALSILPGTSVAGESGALIVRGGAASETQVVINGLRVPKFYSGSIPDVAARSRFNPFDFKGLSFATGGFSAEYGEALSAVLSLKTNGLPEKSRWSIGLMSLGANVAYTHRYGNQAISLSGTYTNISPYLALSKERKNFPQKPQSTALQLGYWNEGEDGRILKAYAQFGADRMETQFVEDVPFYGTEKLGLKNNNIYSQLEYQLPAKGNGLWQTALSFGLDQDKIEVDQGTKLVTQQDAQFRIKRSGEWKDRLVWITGGEYAFQYKQFGFGERPMPIFSKSTDHYAAFFAETSWAISNKWMWRVGMRLDHYGTKNIYPAPRMSLNYIIDKQQQLGISGGWFNQKNELENIDLIASEIAPAAAQHLMLTYQGKWEGRVIRLESYYKNYNRLALIEDGNYNHQGSGFASGVDLFFRERKLIKQGDIWMSASYVKSQRKWETNTLLSNTPFSPEFSLATVYKHFFPKQRLGIALTYRMNTGRFYDNPNQQTAYDSKAPIYHDLSANLSYLTNIRGHFTVIFASINNVTGHDQIHTYRFSQSPDTMGNYAQKPVQSILPRFPFVGIFMTLNEKKESFSKDDL